MEAVATALGDSHRSIKTPATSRGFGQNVDIEQPETAFGVHRVAVA
jgi:hypothetical protein